MNREVGLKWAEALESGEYEQTVGRLRRTGDDGKVRYCCLGVLTDLYIKEHRESGMAWVDDAATYPVVGDSADAYSCSDGVLPGPVVWWLGVSSENPAFGAITAAEWNDTQGATFREIAEMVRREIGEEK